MNELLKGIKGFLRRLIGIGPFKIIAPGESHKERFYAVQAKGGELTYSATTTRGDDIPSSSVLQQDASVTGDFTSISVDSESAGSAIIHVL